MYMYPSIHMHINIHTFLQMCIDTYTYVGSVAYVWFSTVGGFVRVSVVTRYLG